MLFEVLVVEVKYPLTCSVQMDVTSINNELGDIRRGAERRADSGIIKEIYSLSSYNKQIKKLIRTARHC